MKTKTSHTTSAPKLSDLHWLRMEDRAKHGRAIADRAKLRGKLTPTEACQLKLLIIEQESTRSKWKQALCDEGRKVIDLEDFGTRPKGLSVTNRGGEKPVVWLYGAIGEKQGGVSDEEFARQFSDLGTDVDITLRVRSDGGSFNDSLAMREVVLMRRGRTDGYVDGLAASAATLVLCACSSVTMGFGSRYMIHEATGTLQGRAEDFDLAAQQIRETNATIAKIYSQRWKGTPGELLDALHDETWFNAEEAVAWGLADEVSQKLTAAASVSPRHGYKNVPSELRIAAKLEDCPARLATQLKLHHCVIVH